MPHGHHTTWRQFQESLVTTRHGQGYRSGLTQGSIGGEFCPLDKGLEGDAGGPVLHCSPLGALSPLSIDSLLLTGGESTAMRCSRYGRCRETALWSSVSSSLVPHRIAVIFMGGKDPPEIPGHPPDWWHAQGGPQYQAVPLLSAGESPSSRLGRGAPGVGKG